jgi:nucleotide-binding universal stress UspA family protein
MKKQKVMVALKNIEGVASLMDLACRVARGMEAELIALHVVEVPDALDLSAESPVLDQAGRQLLDRAREVACKEHGQPSMYLIRARDTAKTIVSEAEEQDVDLIILGYRPKNPLADILLGSTAQYVARHAPCRVIFEVPALLTCRCDEVSASSVPHEKNAMAYRVPPDEVAGKAHAGER